MRSIILLFLLSLPALLLANPPLGDPNEVWVDCSSGDTIYVGQTVTFRFYIANEDTLGGIYLGFDLTGIDGASWTRAADTGIVIEGTRTIAGAGDLSLTYAGWWSFAYPEAVLTGDTAIFYAVSVGPPYINPGELEYTFAIEIIPHSVGQICIDNLETLIADDAWSFLTELGASIDPVWNGPFCFTVVDPPAGDVNCDGQANVADAVYLINWIFKGGDPPCN